MQFIFQKDLRDKLIKSNKCNYIDKKYKYWSFTLFASYLLWLYWNKPLCRLDSNRLTDLLRLWISHFKLRKLGRTNFYIYLIIRNTFQTHILKVFSSVYIINLLFKLVFFTEINLSHFNSCIRLMQNHVQDVSVGRSLKLFNLWTCLIC